MLSHARTAGLLAATALVLLTIPSFSWKLSTTSAQGPVAQDGVVVLNSGQVLRGQITRVDNRYRVLLGEGSELKILAADVDLIAASLDEAAQRKAARIRPGQIDDHVHFAQWCLRQGLIRQAAGATADALHLAPDDQRVLALERRLNALIQAPPADETPAPGATPTRLSSVELEQALRALPPGSVQRFTTTIHPLLLNRCALSGCHGSRADTEYRLLRPALGQPATRRLTQQNLIATLAWIDPQNPDASPLLARAKAPHGAVVKAGHMDIEQGQYEQLVDWVRQTGRPAAAVRPAKIDQHDPKLLQTGPGTAAFTAARSDSTGSSTAVLNSAPPRKSPATGSSAAAPAARSAAPADPVDPFDPEAFNRRPK